MNVSLFKDILSHPKTINKELTDQLESVLEAYPYFQTARMLYLKGLQNQESFKFNDTLKQTAAYTTDRTVLFDFITAPKTLQVVKAPESLKAKKPKDNSTTSETTENVLNLGKPLAFDQAEKHSFNEWLQLSQFKPIERETPKTSDKFDLIETFIKTNPKIKPKKSDKNKVISMDSVQENPDVMTETLAKVYLEQKKYDKALKAYKILSLKYPEKSSFFADRIKAIHFLKKHNNTTS